MVYMYHSFLIHEIRIKTLAEVQVDYNYCFPLITLGCHSTSEGNEVGLDNLIFTKLLWLQLRILFSHAAAKLLQSCPTLCDPIDGSHQAPPSLGFSRQEHTCGLPFPSPMHQNEKWRWSRSVVSDSQWLSWLQPTRLLHPWDFPGKGTGVGCQHRRLQIDSLIISSSTFPCFKVRYRPWSHKG